MTNDTTNILIVKLSAIGDIIHTLPALSALRAHFPDAHITWLVEEAASELVEGHQALNRVLISGRKRWAKGLLTPQWLDNISEVYRFLRQLRDTRYDLILDFQGLLKSGVLIALARGKRKIGFDRGMEHAEESHLFLNERVPPVDMEIHALTRGMMFLNACLGIEDRKVVFDLPVQQVHHRLVEKLLAQHGVKCGKPLVSIHPTAKWETKLWDNDKFSTLADALIQKHSIQVVFTGGPADGKRIQHIISPMKGHATNLSGQMTLKALSALYGRADCVISTDTGPMHMAAAVGTPVVALFGPTAPWRTGPFGKNHQIIRAGLDCSPCFKRECSTKECMKQISVEDVLNGIEKLGIKWT